jgi:hypothetical protein
MSCTYVYQPVDEKEVDGVLVAQAWNIAYNIHKVDSINSDKQIQYKKNCSRVVSDSDVNQDMGIDYRDLREELECDYLNNRLMIEDRDIIYSYMVQQLHGQTVDVRGYDRDTGEEEKVRVKVIDPIEDIIKTEEGEVLQCTKSKEECGLEVPIDNKGSCLSAHIGTNYAVTENSKEKTDEGWEFYVRRDDIGSCNCKYANVLLREVDDGVGYRVVEKEIGNESGENL